MNEEKKSNNEKMDIFKSGFVKPSDEEVEKIEIEEEIEEIASEEMANDIKYNNIQMKEKANELINELDSQEQIRIEKKKKKRKRKNIILVIGIIIEILIIGVLCYFKFFKESYSMTLTCQNSSTTENNYSITTNIVYYFDKNDNVAKTENSMIYIFNDKKSYDEYKNNYIDTNIKDYEGIEQIDIFDDQNYAYENKTTYTYSKLKKNKNVKVKDNLLTATIKGRKEPITIYIEDYDSVLKTNEKTGFICE